MIENRRIDLSVGDIVYIPRGAVHYFVNTASEPTVAFVVPRPSTAKTRCRRGVSQHCFSFRGPFIIFFLPKQTSVSGVR